MKTYRFVVRNVTIELKEPTMEAFDEFWGEAFLKVLLEPIKDLIRADLQILIDTKTYEIIERN